MESNKQKDRNLDPERFQQGVELISDRYNINSNDKLLLTQDGCV